MRIVLISCTSKKKAYGCPARELYSESPRFCLSYDLAKRIGDKIFILSGKYGLVPDHKVIEPYNETLKDKSIQERRIWANDVLSELREVSDLENDEFVILAGKSYQEYLIPNLVHYWLPLKGKRQGEWIPELKKLIKLEDESDKVMVLHILFNDLPQLDWTMINSIPYHNGIYIMFEKGQIYHSKDRIVRIGTHKGINRLLKRLKDHFIRENADRSIFRKNIGRAFTETMNPHFDTELEKKISRYIRDNITFVCFPVDDKVERLRLEEGIISTLNRHPSFGPSSNWLGLKSPIPEIAGSGLWNKQGLNSLPLSDIELDRIKWLTRFGNDNYRNNMGCRVNGQGDGGRTKADGEVTTPQRLTADDVRRYVDKLLLEAKVRGEDYIDLISGDIHKQMGLKKRMPQVCRIMYEKKIPGDIVLHTTPSGKSSTIKIRYHLRSR
ncbi:MAG: hypothetical protein GX638_07220 [Crenarchaeota archaeon]|nr:hypothetical protein [Thermoproteota archaeon]